MNVKLRTSVGDIVLRLDTDKAPKTADNFIAYVREGFYDGTIFHRVIDDFMIQGGGFEPGMNQKKPGSSIENEAENGLSNATGTVAMARTSDPHSATCQFFINANDNTFLDFKSRTSEGWGYCVFATVTEGMDVVRRITKVTTISRAGHQDVPVEEIFIESAEEISES